MRTAIASVSSRVPDLDLEPNVNVYPNFKAFFMQRNNEDPANFCF